MNNSDLGLPISLGPFASISTLTISKQIFIPNILAGLTYPLDTYAAFGYTVTEIYQIQTASGTVTAAIKINGTSITGLSSISVTSTPQNVSASGANAVSVGDALSLVLSSASGPVNIQFTLVATLPRSHSEVDPKNWTVE